MILLWGASIPGLSVSSLSVRYSLTGSNPASCKGCTQIPNRPRTRRTKMRAAAEQARRIMILRDSYLSSKRLRPISIPSGLVWSPDVLLRLVVDTHISLELNTRVEFGCINSLIWHMRRKANRAPWSHDASIFMIKLCGAQGATQEGTNSMQYKKDQAANEISIWVLARWNRLTCHLSQR